MSWMKLEFIGICMSFWTSPSCQTRLKALCMSRKTARVCSFRLACRVVKLKDGVDGGAFRPESELLRLISRKFFRWVERIFSKTFPAMFRRKMGRYEMGLGYGDHDRGGMFPGQGNWWARMQLLKIALRATMAVRGRFLNMGALSSSGPGAFLLFNSLMCASTSSERTSTTREPSSGWRRRGWLGGCDGNC
jgi:hypothetical protein